MPRRKKPSKDQVLLTCLQHSLRQRLLMLYVEAKEKRSPRELADVTGEHLSKVSYHVRVLAENKAVKLVGTKPRRGSVEHFYRATRLVDEVPWGREVLGLSETGLADERELTGKQCRRATLRLDNGLHAPPSSARARAWPANR